MGRHCNGLVNRHQYVWADELALPQYPNGCAVAIQQSSMLGQLLQLHLRHGHERINFMLRALEVLYAECVDGDNLDASLVADFEDLEALLEHNGNTLVPVFLTLANDSNPRLCPSTVSIWWLRANRRLPSMTNATC
jgi:hypothetical protein